MYSRPSIDDVLDAVSVSLMNDVMPNLTSEKAQTAVVMMQGLLQQAKQVVHVEQQLMAAEHNEMTATLRDVGAIVGESAGAEADRIRNRAQELGNLPDIAPLPAWEDLNSAYLTLSKALVDTLHDLDALVGAGNPAGEKALLRLREHLGPAAREGRMTTRQRTRGGRAVASALALTVVAALAAACNTEEDDQTLRGPDEPAGTIDQTQAASRGGGAEGGGAARLTPTPAGTVTQIPPAVPPAPEVLAGYDLPELFESHVELVAAQARAWFDDDEDAYREAETSLEQHARAIRDRLGITDPGRANRFLQTWNGHLESMEDYIRARDAGDQEAVTAARAELAQAAGQLGAILSETREADAPRFTQEFTLYVDGMMAVIDDYAEGDWVAAQQRLAEEAEHMANFARELTG